MRLVNHFKLQRVIICAHSFGSIVALKLALACPQTVEGIVNMAGLGTIWPNGMSYMYKATVYDHRFDEESWKSKQLYNIDEHRKEIYRQYA